MGISAQTTGEWGGARPGSGRKRTGRTKHRVQFSLSPEAVEFLKALGGNRSAFIEGLIAQCRRQIQTGSTNK